MLSVFRPQRFRLYYLSHPPAPRTVLTWPSTQFNLIALLQSIDKGTYWFIQCFSVQFSCLTPHIVRSARRLAPLTFALQRAAVPTSRLDFLRIASMTTADVVRSSHSHYAQQHRGGTVRKDTGWRASRCRRKKKKPDQIPKRGRQSSFYKARNSNECPLTQLVASHCFNERPLQSQD